uniref:Uncharacterized protein n=1 Tax=Anguilla anguilla TaxID=7936 RepID=A0A0E9VVG1_ANGAN
MLCYTITATH